METIKKLTGFYAYNQSNCMDEHGKYHEYREGYIFITTDKNIYVTFCDLPDDDMRAEKALSRCMDNITCINDHCYAIGSDTIRGTVRTLQAEGFCIDDWPAITKRR